MAGHAVSNALEDQWADRRWRLNNLYWIQNERGERVKFVFNPPQRVFYDRLWYLNLLLKARQWGGTTFIDLFILDDCLFCSNIEAGIIAHNRDDAKKIFRRKIKYPYDNLNEAIRNRVSAVQASQSEYYFSNGSNNGLCRCAMFSPRIPG